MLSRRAIQGSVQVASVLALVASCGGGGGVDEAPITAAMLDSVSFSAQLTAQGTYLSCTGPANVVYSLQRDTDGTTSPVLNACPGQQMLAGDFALSAWTLSVARVQSEAPFVTRSVTTRLPSPVVLSDGTDWVAVRSKPLLANNVADLTLAMLDGAGTTIASFPEPGRFAKAGVNAPPEGATWQWRVPRKDTTFTSDAVPELSPRTTAQLSVWGSLSMGDMNGDGISELLGTTSDGTTLTEVGYEALGLNPLLSARAFRDTRQVDLNDDGLQDIVSDVYGAGCTMIGIKQPGGGYVYQTPARASGACLDGNGETILVADFSGTGRPDIMVPTYQRVDYLHNEGGGVFTDMTADAGLDFPSYRPTIEGAAAVDIDLNGTVDIVMGSEVLLNDGHGHFTRGTSPKTLLMQDEGLSVIDADNDGVFDIIKLHATFGLRVFWGEPDRMHFDDAGAWTTSEQLTNSFGLSVEDFTGNGLPDVVISGGQLAATPPRVCVQNIPRQFTCMDHVLPTPDTTQADLLMLTDTDDDGQAELVIRDSNGEHVVATEHRARNVFRIDLRDAKGRQNMYGHTLRAVCAVDGSLIQLKFVDGGNGYMSQSAYVVPFTSTWCPSAYIEVATMAGMQRFGPYVPGTYTIQVDPNSTAPSAKAVMTTVGATATRTGNGRR